MKRKGKEGVAKSQSFNRENKYKNSDQDDRRSLNATLLLFISFQQEKTKKETEAKEIKGKEHYTILISRTNTTNRLSPYHLGDPRLGTVFWFYGFRGI